MQIVLILLLVYFALLTVSLFWRSHTVRGPWFFLFRAFFPNWQFYHLVGSVPHLYVRFQIKGGEWHAWQGIYPRQTRSVWRLLHNPWGNRDLAQQNLVDHLSSDIKDLGEGADASQLVSYQLVCRLAAQTARAQQAVGLYQLEIRMERPSPQGVLSTDTVLRSPEMAL